MGYVGGKYFDAKHLIAEMFTVRTRTTLVDPFCGGLSVSIAAIKSGLFAEASDIQEGLMALYKVCGENLDCALGWLQVTKEGYQQERARNGGDAKSAGIGYGLSFGNKLWGGFDPLQVKWSTAWFRRVHRALETGRLTLECSDWLSLVPQELEPWKVLYLDPPYEGTMQYKGAPAFDHAAFWYRVEAWSFLNPGRVFVSEYNCPLKCEVVWEKQKRGLTREGNVDRLFKIR